MSYFDTSLKQIYIKQTSKNEESYLDYISAFYKIHIYNTLLLCECKQIYT